LIDERRKSGVRFTAIPMVPVFQILAAGVASLTVLSESGSASDKTDFCKHQSMLEIRRGRKE